MTSDGNLFGFDTLALHAGQQPDSDTGARAAPSLLKRTARTLYDATWRHLFWPDYACLWQRPALARAKSLCGAETFDAVITVSHPFTGHLVGRSLKRVLPGLRWIADIGDPFSLADTVASNNQLLYRGLNKRTEAAVLRECDAVSVTVAGCATVLADRPGRVACPVRRDACKERQAAAPFLRRC